MPSNPDPADGAAGVDILTDLTWSGGDPNTGDTVYYDVHFGTTPMPSFAERIGPYPASQTTITWDPGTLSHGTQYYWQIVAEDDQSATSTGPVWTFTTAELNVAPNTPANPDPSDGAIDVGTGADLSWDGGDANSLDTVYYEVYLGETTPPPYHDTTAGYPATQTRITFDPGSLNTQTPYYWQIIAFDSHGASTAGPVWSFTTQEQQPEMFYASQDIVVANGGITGDFTSTHGSDNLYEAIAEQVSNKSFLEHKWTINVTGGLSSYIFYVEAHHSANSENDDFVFSYSTDDVNYTHMVLVNKIADDDTSQSYVLPASLSGTVHIRVIDTDRTKWNKVRDTIYIDHFYIEGTGTPPENDPPYTPSNPGPADGAVDVDVNADLGWNGGDPNSTNTVQYEVSLGETSPPPYFDTTPSYPASQTAITFDPGSLNANTQYYWQIVAHDNFGKSTAGPVWSFTTGAAPLIFVANLDIPVLNGGIAGDFIDTHGSDNVYEAITEKANNRSALEHKWTIDVYGGYASYTFFLEAHHTFNTEGDDFIFAYSTDDVTYMNIVTVTKTTDNNTYQTAVLPASLSGTIYIKVVDKDRTKGNRVKDTIYVDHMYIEAGL